ncbi:uncharacterized protein Z518_09732 [Rhinocladiella mackenziei CBS 650.93]|uniref:Uncharacterized protein n=1 Tax=Rhinocladiella mackenziei CBS 650.93 TaxID=1442369 RepID=A0A0D2FF71_9EURO|nr:uncharacterized protein Z518_09732 [Rhinocladiella mackenziei CBS 650.93]KIX00667.1 hypothetical protein Z518_09732 [Rhinocladiella mackenziei CBS 650.93]
MDSEETAGTRNVWSPYQAPSHPEKPPPTSCKPIRIRHPVYEDDCNSLLMLWPLDSGGVHYGTVRIACAFLADNAWDGYLSVDKGGVASC